MPNPSQRVVLRGLHELDPEHLFGTPSSRRTGHRIPFAACIARLGLQVMGQSSCRGGILASCNPVCAKNYGVRIKDKIHGNGVQKTSLIVRGECSRPKSIPNSICQAKREASSYVDSSGRKELERSVACFRYQDGAEQPD